MQTKYFCLGEYVYNEHDPEEMKPVSHYDRMVKYQCQKCRTIMAVKWEHPENSELVWNK